MRLEETLVNQVHTGSTKFEFDGYSHEMVGYAVRKLHDVRFIIANNASVWSKDQLRWWPMGFRGRGLEFLAASKDEDGLGGGTEGIGRAGKNADRQDAGALSARCCAGGGGIAARVLPRGLTRNDH